MLIMFHSLLQLIMAVKYGIQKCSMPNLEQHLTLRKRFIMADVRATATDTDYPNYHLAKLNLSVWTIIIFYILRIEYNRPTLCLLCTMSC